jgi:hypothetical protein
LVVPRGWVTGATPSRPQANDYSRADRKNRDYPGAGSEDGGEPDPAEERDQRGTGGAADDE